MNAMKQEITELLVSGTDERTSLDKRGLSNYGISFTDSSLTNRGSCTCNHITQHHIDYLSKKLRIVSTSQDWISLIDKVRNSIQQEVVGITETNFEVLFGPSGTDLLYFPLLFSRERFPEKKSLYIVTCIDELGSGAINASQGKYFSAKNQFGEGIPKGESIIDTDFIETHYLNARCPQGYIENPREKLSELISFNPDKSIIVNLVVGSKSGIEDNLSWIDELAADNVMWNVDMCQFRHSYKLIAPLIQKGVSVMITGSKFYQSPPFCGAILIPESWIKKIENIKRLSHFDLFNKVFSKYDLPPTLRQKTNLPAKINKGGVLRWLVTFKSISDLRLIEKNNISKITYTWNAFVNNELGKHKEFMLMPEQNKTDPTIISFQVKGKDGVLNHQQLRTLFISVVTSNQPDLPTKRVFIGQPVAYGDKSFLRLAIGANDIVDFNARGADLLEIDKRIIALISEKLIELESIQP